MNLVPKVLTESSSSTANKIVSRLRDEMKASIAKEYEKTIFILQFLTCDESEVQMRITENEFGLTEEDFAILLNMQ